MKKNGGEVECHGRSGVAGDHHDGDFVEWCDAEQGYEYGHSHGVVVRGSRHCVGDDRTMVTAFSHVLGRVMPGEVDRR